MRHVEPRKPAATQLPPRRRRKGAALAVALVVLMAITAVGLFAIHSSRTELSVSINQSIAKKAEYVAEAGLLAVMNKLAVEPAIVTQLVAQPATGTTECQKARTLCLTGASFFPRPTGYSVSTFPFPSQAFALDSFMPSGTVVGTHKPALWADFVVKLHDPIRSDTEVSGFSVGSGATPFCTYTITLTSRGLVTNYNVMTRNSTGWAGKTVDHEKMAMHREVSEKKLRAFVRIPVQGDLCK